MPSSSASPSAGAPPKSPDRSPTRRPPPCTKETPLLAGAAEEGRDEHEEAALLEPP
ncbi:Uu.00g056070.m01.CDS01 [Anthostomella pinea]|uniref:Uu.00g056070.m01.CDS01 n=1 Tax=Anthostomella pinea TaxID=933095 RepID=A0AAI8VWW3_9PEZI|nr:Uu.00g056070.m01.CDS01 [Anthostomella pinea]